MNAVFSIDGLPELNARLDKIAVIVANPITREALAAGGKVIKDKAESLVHRLTGTLAGDIVVVTRMRAASNAKGNDEKYVLIGPGWNPDLYRRTARNRGASGREVAPDQTTNPGVYGYFLEVGHRSPGQGLAHNPQYRRDQAAARKQGKRVNTHDYGNLTTPPYPWLEPAFNDSKDDAVAAMADVIEMGLL
jgi:HK97 gp10 family phage protein